MINKINSKLNHLLASSPPEPPSSTLALSDQRPSSQRNAFRFKVSQITIDPHNLEYVDVKYWVENPAHADSTTPRSYIAGKMRTVSSLFRKQPEASAGEWVKQDFKPRFIHPESSSDDSSSKEKGHKCKHQPKTLDEMKEHFATLNESLEEQEEVDPYLERQVIIRRATGIKAIDFTLLLYPISLLAINRMANTSITRRPAEREVFRSLKDIALIKKMQRRGFFLGFSTYVMFSICNRLAVDWYERQNDVPTVEDLNQIFGPALFMEMRKFNPSLEMAKTSEPVFLPIKNYKELNSERAVERLQRFVNESKLLGQTGSSLVKWLLAWKREEAVESFRMVQEALQINFMTFIALRMQNVDYVPHNQSLFTLARHIGPIGLLSGAFKGLIPLYFAKRFLGEGVQLACWGADQIEEFKYKAGRAIGKEMPEPKRSETPRRPSLLSSALVFLGACFIAHPFYLLGVRIQAGSLERSLVSRRAHRHQFSTFSYIVRNQGPLRGAYSGFGPAMGLYVLIGLPCFLDTLYGQNYE